MIRINKKFVVDSLTVISLLVGIGSGIASMKPADAQTESTGFSNRERIVYLEARVEDIMEELAYRDSVIRQLIYTDDKHSAQLLFETLIQERQESLVEEVTVSASSPITAADLTYDDFKRMIRDWELPLVWYYWHYEIMTFTAFVSFILFGIWSWRTHRG